MTTHCMIDLETLGVGADCVVLTLGAVKFDPFDLQDPHTPLYFKLDVDTQTALGRTIDQGTLEWWGKQSAESQLEAMGDEGRIDLEDAISQLNKYLVGVDKIWAQGPLFDINILVDLYKDLEQPVPWQYWQIRDSRTVFDMGDDSAKTGNKAAHNALADAYSQAVSVQQVYKQCGVKRK